MINSYRKIIKNLKKIIHECVAKDWLDKDPFIQYRVKHIDPEVPHLTEDELHKVRSKNFSIERLALVKDMFLFSCYTGLAYIDAASLTRDHITIGPEGKSWVIINRQKRMYPPGSPFFQLP